MHSEECKYSGAKYILLCVGMVAVIACTILNIINVKKPFLRVYEEGSFNINGVSVFWGKDKVTKAIVSESHQNENYSIERDSVTYIKENGSYYIRMNGNMQTVTETEDEMPEIEEMFNRASVISNYQYSALKRKNCYVTEIPVLTSSDYKSVICQEYYIIEDNREDCPTLRLYFCDGELMAIRSKDDSRFIFYVDSWEKIV